MQINNIVTHVDIYIYIAPISHIRFVSNVNHCMCFVVVVFDL